MEKTCVSEMTYEEMIAVNGGGLEIEFLDLPPIPSIAGAVYAVILELFGLR